MRMCAGSVLGMMDWQVVMVLSASTVGLPNQLLLMLACIAIESLLDCRMGCAIWISATCS